ncbi:hypothetical protein MGG_08772 [Pyricularia oryzae 70-15]|uniref:Phosphatidylethanolamine-binding protein n=1 Tax=Pyricularia oryzae (strain 70-15 / ATCC MYA-4617 / FGSC 8958) TaxID=242507 RepID=G4NFN0_PYRO7|nr:uncharacterized protein MGG_08772 [Pyricularia oryzae 70-15]EHA46837.1 hypothetical protein MGG_08772 [Pyricularia oryzae 70-15]
MKATILTLAAAVAPVLAGIPPAEFKFPEAESELSVEFTWSGQSRTVMAGQLFGSNITSQKPQLAVDQQKFKALADYKGEYIIVMIDPDAPSPDDPKLKFILHWLQTSVTAQTTMASNSTLGGQMALLPKAGQQPQVPYAPPAPPPTSSAHRYIIYAFAQPSNFTMPRTFANFSGTNRASFNIDNFVRDANLDKPLAAEYFYVSRQSNVPGTFVDQPGGSYPGGNGNAIFTANQTRPASPSSGSNNGTRPAPTTPSSGGSGGGGGTPAGGQGTTFTPPSIPGNAAVKQSAGMGALLGAGVVGLTMLL